MRIKLFKRAKDYELSVETASKIRRISEMLEEMTTEGYGLPNKCRAVKIPKHTHTIKIRKYEN